MTLEFWFILWIPGQHWFSQQTNGAHPGLRPPQSEPPALPRLPGRPAAFHVPQTFLTRSFPLGRPWLPRSWGLIRPQLSEGEAKKLRKQRKENKGK